MAALSASVNAQSLYYWGTPALVVANLVFKGTKILRIASDALTDRTVVNPEEAYVLESSQ